jgi:uncharacterized protein (UPF0548 family)
MWSTTPVHRWEMTGEWPRDAPPDLPPAAARHDQLQRMEDGVGPLLHRIYRTRIVGSAMTAEQLTHRIAADLDEVAPSEFATFQKLEGDDRLAVGDEYVVRMPGPWDGPVVAAAADRTSFRLATLSGHLEAGQIEVRAVGNLRSLGFEIESWARSGGRLSDLLYSRLRLSKEVQLHMWSSVLRNVVKLAEGQMEGGIVITTRRVASAQLPSTSETSRPGEEGSPALTALARRQVNFDSTRVHEYVADRGWRVDDMVEPLPHESSGRPREGGSWAVAREAMDTYQLADPAVVSATYDRSTPLEGRDMLLRIRYGPLRFDVGVRIGEVYENTIEIEGREVLVSGWSYRTLEGHFEEGQMHYELWKWLDSGDVEFHLRAVSRPARRGNWLLRTGFRLFGRSRQLRFYRQVCRRIKRLTEAQMESERVAALRARRS